MTVLCAHPCLGTAATPPPERAPGFSDREDGISCPFFDAALGARWPGGRPVGIDADGTPGGPRAFAADNIPSDDTRRVRRIDLGPLVQGWWSGRVDNQGVLMRAVAGDMATFHARETPDLTLRPQLLLQFGDGRKRFLEPVADATLDCSTYRGLGGLPTLTAKRDTWVALRFDLDPLRTNNARPPNSAELILVRTPSSPTAAVRLAVFAVQSPLGAPGAARSDGLASRYSRDAGIDTDRDVLFADGFEGRSLDKRWTRGMAAATEIVSAGAALGFVPLSGKALRVTIPRGEQLGLDIRYRFAEQQGTEPEEIYFRYYLRLSRNWLAASDGGKLPGLAGTYGKAGWGGRAWDGAKGWSMRGSYDLLPAAGHAGSGNVSLGTYAYHSGSGDKYGEILAWSQGGLAGLVAPDRWYCIEQRLALNTPGLENGMFQVWVDGRLALSRDKLKLRTVANLRIEEVWMNFFHGGTEPAPADMHAFIDGVVIARSYVGPMAP